ncbi:MAG: autotransporter domain-containing protein [Planctomycetaceae bacterium]|jgi:uncharacterized protein with beta-barrel porin domain|nr:autotransporter domain-containing protein [Planctomycetaceae bacterium]
MSDNLKNKALVKNAVILTLVLVIISYASGFVETGNMLNAQTTYSLTGNGNSSDNSNISAGIIISETQYWHNGTTTANSYTSNDYLQLSTFTALTEASGKPVAGILSKYNDLLLDLNGVNVTVENTATSGSALLLVAAGFGYASNDNFTGEIWSSTLSNLTATSTSGTAYGMVFANEDMDNVVSLGAGAFIEVGTLKVTTNSTTGEHAVGFQAFNVDSEAFVSVEKIEFHHDGSGGSAVGMLLGGVSGFVVGKIDYSNLYEFNNGINITGTIKGDDTVASGFHATEIIGSQSSYVRLGTITISSSDGNDEGSLYGVQINQVGDDTTIVGPSDSSTVGTISGNLIVGEIKLGTASYRAKEAAGLLLKNADNVKVAPSITESGKVTLDKITVYSESGYALGVSLGAYSPLSTDVDFGSAASGTLILNGDIKVDSTNGDAVGIFAGQLVSLDVKHIIQATSNNAASYGYGIKTMGKTEHNGTDNDKASVINILSDSSASSVGAIIGTTKSVSLGASSGDTVNLSVNNWLNANSAFTMEGVELFHVIETNDFSTATGIKDSRRGTATNPNAITVTKIDSNKVLTVADEFFSEGGKQRIEGGGYLVVTKGDDPTPALIDNYLEFNAVSVELKAGAQFFFNSTGFVEAENNVKITNGSTITFNRAGNEIAGIGRTDWAPDWTTKPIGLTIEGNSVLKFKGDLDNGDTGFYLHPFKTYIGSGGAVIEIDAGMAIEPGKINRATGASGNISITKSGNGELKLIDVFDLGTGGTIRVNAGTLSVNDHGTGYDPTVTDDEIIKSTPNLLLDGNAKFVLNGLSATVDALTGTNGTEISIDANQLAVNYGIISGKMSSLSSGRLVKNGTGYLTINGDNSGMAGAIVQNNGTIELQSDLGDVTRDGHIDQVGGTFIFNGGGNGSSVKVFGDVNLGADVVIKGNVIAKSFVLGSNAEVTFEIDPSKDWDNLITVTGTPFTDVTKNVLLDAANQSGLLYSRVGAFNNNDGTFSLDYETTTLSNYALKNGMTRNVSRMGVLFDGLMNQSSTVAEAIYGWDKDMVDELLLTFLGSELSAEAQRLAFSNPQYRIFNHLRSLDRSTPSGVLGQSGFRVLPLSYDLWFEGGYRSERVKGDSNAWSYDVERGGMFVGMDMKVGDRITSGLVFSYGSPRVSNRIGKITADDISFGIYSKFRVFWDCSVNVFLGYGVQNYKYNHIGYTADYDGESLYASMEVVRPIQFYTYGQLIPLVALDFQKAWTDAFVEGNAASPSYFDLRFGKSSIDQAVLRFGLNSKIMPTRQFQLRTRLQYGLQVAGDLYAATNTSFIVNPTVSQNIRSVKRGRNNLNIGLGTDFYTTNESTRIFLDYDYDYNKNANAHSFQIGLVTTR